MELIDLLMHTDDFLTRQVEANLWLTYVILFLIIFAESAFIVCPFLPGDGLLFSVGVVAAATRLDLDLLLPILVLAAVAGFILNYLLGMQTGAWFIKKDIGLFHRYYGKTKIFLDKYGIQSVLLSRFFPIVRTYLPFVAGMVKMDYPLFIRYTVIGAVIWVSVFTIAGYLLGEIPWVKENYGLIFLGLILLTLIPLLLAFLKTRQS